MPNQEDFRRLALEMEDAVESAHMGRPDFRAYGRIFATLHDDGQQGMVKLTPDQQEKFVSENPASFAPEHGAWGRHGGTSVRLDSVDENTLGEAMTLAWQNTVRQRVTTPSAPSSKSGRRPRNS
jgi:hypothetical protein